MESVGEFFRQVRETKGLTIDEVASKTRIRSDFVKALEDGNFAKLPDQVFARGFVRSYARSLGLDEEDAIHRFAESAGSFYEKQGERERLRQRQVEEDRRRRANRKAVAIAIMAAVLTLIFLLSREQSSVVVTRPASDVPSSAKKPQAGRDGQNVPSRPPGESQSVSATAKLPDPPPIAMSQPAEKPPTSNPPSPPRTVESTRPPSVPAAGLSEGPLAGLSVDGPMGSDEPLVLDLEATELSWVVVQIDAGSPQEALLRPGQRAQWKAQDQFLVTLGNAGGVRAELNGKPQRPFGPSGKVVRDVVIRR
ncbi:MAG TPA: RodZ domain-containing protein [Nitrospiraceae bacterium]|nr:RodZ domain-containing protein [Nitrospiraceae bacterium]